MDNTCATCNIIILCGLNDYLLSKWPFSAKRREMRYSWNGVTTSGEDGHARCGSLEPVAEKP